ncbi:MAG TPA: hypothetical protein PLO51_05550, partial [Candidatus Micrarchaeota archaeon]|nr:hypothetical protein [Candidatus Micrarchaeota archaeon]
NSDTVAGDMTAYSQSPYVRILQPDTFTILPGQSHTVEYEVSLPGNYPAGRTSLLITATKNPDNGAAFGVAVALNYVIFIERKDAPMPVEIKPNSTANENTNGNGTGTAGNPTNWAANGTNIPANGMNTAANSTNSSAVNAAGNAANGQGINTTGNSTNANPGATGKTANGATETGNQGSPTNAVQGAAQAQGKNIVQLWLDWLLGFFKF